MEKDTRLVNIYLKIHHKRSLTLDDLGYLAEYDPECFAKTCENVVYNFPETKPIMEPVVQESLKKEERAKPAESVKQTPNLSDRQNIRQILENLKRLEINHFCAVNLDSDKVKNLLGNLYMELLFPHNDKYTFIHTEDNGKKSSFDKKA